MKTRVFFFHYNKVASKKAGKPQITVHWKGACHLVDNVVCNVKTYGHINKRQPYFVIKGRAEDILFTTGYVVANIL